MSLERANQLRDLGRWADAEPLYAELLRQEPGNADARFGHALNLMASGALDAAIAELTQVLDGAPDRADVRYNRSVCYAMTGQDDAALADLDRLLADGSGDWYVWADRGGLLARVGRLPEAISSLRTAVGIQPAELAAHFNLGCVLAQVGELDEAHAELALAAQGGFPRAAEARDQVRRQLAEGIDEADIIAVLEELRRDPSTAAVTELTAQRPYLMDHDFRRTLATAANSHPSQGSGLDRQWMEVLNRLAAPQPRVPRPGSQAAKRTQPRADPADIARYERLSERLLLLHRRGHTQEMPALSQELTALAAQLYGDESAEYGQQLMNLAILEARDGSRETADGHLRQAFGILAEAWPGALPEGLASYARLLSNAGFVADAVLTYQLALTVMRGLPHEIGHRTAAHVYKGLGESMVKLGSSARAEEILREAVSDERFAADDAADSLATVLTTLAQAVSGSAERIQLCQRAVALRQQAHGELHPDVARAMRNLGRVCFAAGDLGTAQRWLTRSAEIWRQLAGAAADPAEEGLTWGDLAKLYATAGSAAQARAAAANALAIVDRLAQARDPQVPYILNEVRNAFRTLGDLDAELTLQERLITEAGRDPTSEDLNTLADIYFRRKEYDQARHYYTQAIELVVATEPENHEVIAILQHNLANILADTGKDGAAIEMHEKSLAGLRKVWHTDDPRLLGCMLELAELYFDAGQPAGAERLLSEARPFLSGQSGLESRGAALAMQLGQSPDEAGLTPAQDQIGRLAQEAQEALDSGDPERAESLLRQAIDIAVGNLGPRDLETTALKLNLGVVRRQRGLLAGLTELFREVLEIREEQLAPDDVRIVNVRLELAEVLHALEQDTEAAELAAQVIQGARSGIAAHSLGRAHTIAGIILHRRGDLAESEQHLREAMRIADETDAPENRISARRNLALLLLDAGRPDEAETLSADAYQLSAQRSGLEAPATAQAALDRVKVLRVQGHYADAELLAREALERLERAHPAGHPAITDALNEVGLALSGQGISERAESFFARAITAAAAENLGREATLMLNQAAALADLGYAERAVRLARDAAERIAERSGTDGIRYGKALARLGGFEEQAGQRSAAVGHLTQAFRIIESAAGGESPQLLTPLHDLAQIYLVIGARRAARSFAERALSIATAAYGPAHPALGPLMITLARCLAFTGETAEATRLSLAAAELSPAMTGIVRWLSWLQAATGDRGQALATLQRVIAVEDARLPGVLDLASEEHRNAYAAALWDSVSQYLSLACDEPSWTRRAWELVMRRRALASEYLRFERQAALRGDRPDLAAYLRELADIRADLARAVTRGETDDADRLRQRRAELERLLATRLPVDSRTAWLGPVDAEQVIAALPAQTTLIEFVRINAIDFANLALGAPVAAREDDPLHTKPRQRYLAFTADAGDAAALRLIDLGPAEPIEEEIAVLRAHLTSPAYGAGDPGEALRRLLIGPLRDVLSPGQRLVVVPGGDIGEVPLQVLPSGNGRGLIDDHLISYISSSREIMRWTEGAPRRPAFPALILADPDYDLGGPVDPASPDTLPRLPGTLAEAEQIGVLLATQPLTGPAAAKIALEEARSPMIVHLATHGLYLPARAPRPPGNYYETVHTIDVPGEGTFVAKAEHGPPDQDITDPLLRSAVALAGYNAWLNGAAAAAETGNGVLTADEVCSLDLQGTRLVTLSACDTGLGDQRQSEGLVGLRWAFGVAGAMTVVSSLWKVADEPTQELMTEFYRRLLDGTTIPEALRAAQLALRDRYADPFWWGAFVCHGDPRVTLR